MPPAKAAVGECRQRLVVGDGLQLHGGIVYLGARPALPAQAGRKAGVTLFGNAGAPLSSGPTTGLVHDRRARAQKLTFDDLPRGVPLRVPALAGGAPAD